MRRKAPRLDDQSWQRMLLNLADAIGPVSHELNNLLNNMVLQAALLDRVLADDLRDKVSAFRTLPLRASQLLQKLTEYRHLIQPPMTEVSLNSVVRGVVEACRSRGWEVSGKYAGKLPPVQANSTDVARLAELLISAGNAAGPPVRVMTRRVQDQAYLVVEDAGANIAIKNLEGLFNPLTPARLGENSLERAASQAIARRLGVDLEVNNLPRRGLAVMVKFSLQPPGQT